jgi:hypothetical protein
VRVPRYVGQETLAYVTLEILLGFHPICSCVIYDIFKIDLQVDEEIPGAATKASDEPVSEFVLLF